MRNREPKVLAVASGGGHWVQLLRLCPAFQGARLAFVTVDAAYRDDLPAGARLFVINDATRWNKFALIRQAIAVLWVVLRTRPDLVVSTGAAPGYFAVRFGKLLGAKTIWVDSMANVERMSLSGEKVEKFADLWLTQWEHLARPGGPECKGAVL